MHERCVPVLRGMCGFSCSVWPSDPQLTWPKFHLQTHTHILIQYAHTYTPTFISLLDRIYTSLKTMIVSDGNGQKKSPTMNGRKQHPFKLLQVWCWWFHLTMNLCSIGAPGFLAPILGCAQQAAQLGPRCGNHVMWSWKPGDKRPTVGLLLGPGSVPRQFN